MAGYISRVAKALFSFLPSIGAREGSDECGHCSDCKAPVKCNGAIKRRIDENEDVRQEDNIPRKKAALLPQKPESSDLTGKQEVDPQPSNSELNLQIVQNLNQLTKVIANLAKERKFS